MLGNGIAYILQAQISFWKVLLGIVAQCTQPCSPDHQLLKSGIFTLQKVLSCSHRMKEKGVVRLK